MRHQRIRKDSAISRAARDPWAALAVLEEASRAVARLRLVRGASRRTHRRAAQATAVLVAAAGLVTGTSLASPAHAATPQFVTPILLPDVGDFAIPTFADVDGDGDVDAFIGAAEGDTIYVENTGSSSAPAFASPSTNPFGLANVGGAAQPAFADLDGDGDLDAFVGEREGDTFYFENTGSSGAPAFAAPSVNPFGLADVGGTSSPRFADLDGDGDLDAFIGEYFGNTIYFENTGSSSAPVFAAASTNPFGLTDVGYFSNPTFADLDGDGDLDAFVGELYGNTVYFANTGSSSAPAFAATSSNPFGLADLASYSSPTFADLDGDGDRDAFVGIDSGDTIFFANLGSSRAPAFAAAGMNLFGLAAVGFESTPTFVDLDGDGDLDAYVGNADIDPLYFANMGSRSAPTFAPGMTNPFGLAPVGDFGSPTFADLDDDGDFDAFIGGALGNTLFFENTGSGVAPAFAAPVTNPFGLTDVGYFTAPTFADLDGDGDLDAFIGERDGDTFYFENTGAAARPPSPPPRPIPSASPTWGSTVARPSPISMATATSTRSLEKRSATRSSSRTRGPAPRRPSPPSRPTPLVSSTSVPGAIPCSSTSTATATVTPSSAPTSARPSSSPTRAAATAGATSGKRATTATRPTVTAVVRPASSRRHPRRPRL